MRAVRAATRVSKSALSAWSVVTKLAIDMVTATSASPRQLTAVVMAASYLSTACSVAVVTWRPYHWVQTAATSIRASKPRITLHILWATRRSLNFMLAPWNTPPIAGAPALPAVLLGSAGRVIGTSPKMTR